VAQCGDTAQGLCDRDCIQIARTACVTGTVNSYCSGPGCQELYTDCAQGLSDRDCIKIVLRARVTGTIYILCSGPG
jgi:hypothetical protein